MSDSIAGLIASWNGDSVVTRYDAETCAWMFVARLDTTLGLDADTINRLRCAIVAGSANNQFATPEDADRAHDTGIVVAPDYVINARGHLP